MLLQNDKSWENKKLLQHVITMRIPLEAYFRCISASQLAAMMGTSASSVTGFIYAFQRVISSGLADLPMLELSLCACVLQRGGCCPRCTCGGDCLWCLCPQDCQLPSSLGGHQQECSLRYSSLVRYFNLLFQFFM